MRSLLCALCLFMTVSHTSFAQSFELPKNIDLSKPENYNRYEKDVINCVNWLEKNPASDGKQKDAVKFLIEWVSGCPYITLNVDQRVLPFAEDHPEMLIYFMGGWTKFALEHKSDTSSIHGTVAGLKSIIKMYKANASAPRDASIDKLVSLNDKGKLEEWVATQLK